MGEYWEESIGFYKDAYESHGRKKNPLQRVAAEDFAK